MEAQKRRFQLNKNPAWGLSLITALISFLLIFLLAIIFDLLGLSRLFDNDMAAYFCSGVAVAVACYLICRNHPKSFWYVPFISNAVSIIAALAEPNFWTTNMWIAFGSGWLLSLIGTIAGVLKSRRAITIH